MNQKESFDCTVKYHHLYLLVSFDCRDDLAHLRKHLRTEDVERRVVKRDSPILGRAPDQTYLSSPTCCVILIFHGCCLLIIWFHGVTLVNSRTAMQEVDDKFCCGGWLFFRDPVPAIR